MEPSEQKPNPRHKSRVIRQSDVDEMSRHSDEEAASQIHKCLKNLAEVFNCYPELTIQFGMTGEFPYKVTSLAVSRRVKAPELE